MTRNKQENDQNRTPASVENIHAMKTHEKIEPVNRVEPHVEPNVDPEHALALEKQRKRREQEPLLYCKAVARWPVQTFLITLSLHLLMVVISIILVTTGYDLFPLEFGSLPLEINDQPWRPRNLAWINRDEFDGHYDVSPKAVNREEQRYRSNIDLYYDGKGDNVFTKEALQKIQSIETELVSVPSYKNSYCQLNYKGNACVKPLSILRYFDGTFAHVNPIFTDPYFDNITAVLYEASVNNETRANFRYFLGKSNSISTNSVYTSITRSLIPVGYPLPNTSDADYELIMKEWLVKDMKPVLVRTREECTQFDFVYKSSFLWEQDTIDLAMRDATLALGSICFIFILILVHTRSLWVTGFAVLSIITSFVCTNLIYRIVLDFRYIGFFHLLTIFIVLGIGADDIFVFYDVWRNTAYEKYPSLAHRLSDAYRKSVFSMFFTSLTTSVAFFSNSLSPLLATRSFGVFSGIVIIVNYLSVILYFPTVVIMYHTKFEKWTWPCLRFCIKRCKTRCTRTDECNDLTDRGTNSSKTNTTESAGYGSYSNRAFEGASDITDPHIKVGSDDHPKARKQKSVVVRFFRDKYSAFVTHRVCRWVILVVMLAVLVFFCTQAARLEPDNEDLTVLKASHVYRIADDLSANAFISTDIDRTLSVHIVWGMLENDMSDCHFSTPDCQGKQRWDPDFNPNTVEAQQALQRLCDTLKNMPSSQANDLHIKNDFVTGELEIQCYITHLNTFLQKESLATGKDWDLPFNYTKTIDFMEDRPTFYNTSGFDTGYKFFLQIPISYWLTNRYTYKHEEDFYLFDTLIGEEISSYSHPLKTDNSKLYGNNIKYVAVRINTTVRAEQMGYAVGIPIRDKWEEFTNQQMKLMPPEMRNGFQTVGYFWHWVEVAKMLAENAVFGVVLGVGLAFPILVIATKNIITGFLATFTMCCSTVSVIGVIPLAGWKLGVMVSMNMCMVVGLTVDYVVHLAEGYTLSLHLDRLSRVRDMLDEMAISVFFGACTTLGATIFMLPSELAFFLQFAIFMFVTIGFSLVFSMGMFVTIMGLIGPQGDTGNLLVLLSRLRDRCKSR